MLSLCPITALARDVLGHGSVRPQPRYVQRPTCVLLFVFALILVTLFITGEMIDDIERNVGQAREKVKVRERFLCVTPRLSCCLDHQHRVVWKRGTEKGEEAQGQHSEGMRLPLPARQQTFSS
jgi:hypothetical protein